MALRVLIVEDQREMARILRQALKHQWPDMDVVDVPSAEEALLEFLKQAPDLLILDLGLPGLPGHEFLRRLRNTYPTLPVVVVTAASREETEALIRNLRVDEVFYKPFSPTSLVDAVARLLNLAHDPVAEILRELYEHLRAQSVFVVNPDGDIVVAYGHPPEWGEWQAMRLSAVTMLESGRNLGRLLGEAQPSLHLCRGSERVLLLWDLDEGYGLALWGTPEHLAQWLGAWKTVEAKAARLWDALKARLGEVPQPEGPPAALQDAKQEEVPLPQGPIDAQEAERFWEEVAEQTHINMTDPSTLSYEDARRLGLLPEGPFTPSDDAPLP